MARAEIAPDGDSPLQRTPQALGDLAQVVLPADEKAPTAARRMLRLRFGPVLDARVASDAQLLVSELVTNNLLHGALDGEDSIVVRMQLHAETLRLEVHNHGATGTFAANGGDPLRGHFGLDLVRLLGARWGIRRGEDACIWVEMARA